MASDEFRAIFERSHNPMLLADDERRCVHANAAACALLRLPLESVIGRRVDDFTPPEVRSALDGEWGKFTSEGRRTGRYQLLLPEGDRVCVEYSATANVEPGRHLSILSPVGKDPDDDHADEPARVRVDVPAGRLGAGRPLSDREREVVTAVALGESIDEIAERLGLSPETVRTHLRNLRQKLGARNRPHAVALALKRDLIRL